MDTITVGSTVDFVVTIPYQLGYHPGQSLAVVGFVGKRVLGIMRIDLCEPDRPDVGADCLRTFAGAGADGVIIVAFESRPSQGASLLRSFRDGAAAHDIAVRDCFIVRGSEWFAVSATGHALGRARPLPDASRVPAIAEFVARGRSPMADRQALRTLVECEESTRSAEVGHRVRGLVTSLTRPPAPLTDLGDPPVTREAVRSWQLLLTEPEPPVDDVDLVAVALVGLLDRGWRDGLLAWLCPDSMSLDLLRADVLAALQAIPRAVSSEPGPPAAGTDDGPADAADADSPVRDELGRRLFSLCRLLPDDTGEAAAAVLTVAAHVSWCDGDGTLASIALERALRVAPRYRLAELLDRLVAAGVRASDARTVATQSVHEVDPAA